MLDLCLKGSPNKCIYPVFHSRQKAVKKERNDNMKVQNNKMGPKKGRNEKEDKHKNQSLFSFNFIQSDLRSRFVTKYRL